MTNFTEQDIKMLEAYAKGSLPEADKLKLEMEMERNPQFGEEAKAYIELFEGFCCLELEQFDDMMNNWESKFEEKNQVSTKTSPSLKVIHKKSRSQYWAAAAILVLLLPAGFWFFSQSSGPQNCDELFAANFAAEEIQMQLFSGDRGVVRSEDETSDNDFFDVVSGTDAVTPASEDAVTPVAEEGVGSTSSASEAYKNAGLDAYNQGQFTNAIEQFNSYLDIEGTKEQHEIRFYLGVAYLSEEYTQKAKSIFLKLSKLKNNRKYGHFRQSSEWYLALTLIKERQITKAVEQLQDIVNAPKKHDYHEKAQNMLAQIESNNIQ